MPSKQKAERRGFDFLLYFPCRCLCLGFFELERNIRISTIVLASLSQIATVVLDLPDNIHTVLSADRLEHRVSIQAPNFAQITANSSNSIEENHTLHPSHSLLTEERVFMPRTCSICRVAPTVAATELPVPEEVARSLVKLFRIICEKGRRDIAPGIDRRDTEGRSWRRALGAPRTLRSENMIAVISRAKG
jgi:hypothetical protein